MGWFSRFFGRPSNTNYSIADPALAEIFSVSGPTLAGISVGEWSSLGLSAVWRSCSLIAGTIASLPMRTLRDVDGSRTRVSSFLDEPGGPEGLTPFEWKETVLLHMLLHGNAFLAHVWNGAGALIALVPIHPLAVSVKVDFSGVVARKVFEVSLLDGSRRTFDENTMTHIPALSLDGVRGMSPIAVAKNSLATAIAGDRAAARAFGNGAMISGLVTPEDDVTEEEGKAIKAGLQAKIGGWDNAGDIAFVNRKLKFTPWTMSLEDAQFLESRQFQIEEIARWYGVPPHLLMQLDKQTSWGTGVAEQNRALARYTLTTWTSRVEERLSRLLPRPRFVEFDYVGLLQPAPEQEIPLLIDQVKAGLLTRNEARRIRNLPPVEGGDALANQEQVAA